MIIIIFFYCYLIFAHLRDGLLRLTLFNPITLSTICHLPTLPFHNNLHHIRTFLSSHPLRDPPPVLAVWAYTELFFINIGDHNANWTKFRFQGGFSSQGGGAFAYCHGCFFFSNNDRRQITVLDSRTLETCKVDVPLDEFLVAGAYYMAVLSGELFLLASNHPNSSRRTPTARRFEPFKLVKDEGQWVWSRERNLLNNNSRETDEKMYGLSVIELVRRDPAYKGGIGDSAFFVCENLSVAVASPNAIGCFANCVYTVSEQVWHIIVGDGGAGRREDRIAVTFTEAGMPNNSEFERKLWVSSGGVNTANMTGFSWFIPKPY